MRTTFLAALLTAFLLPAFVQAQPGSGDKDSDSMSQRSDKKQQRRKKARAQQRSDRNQNALNAQKVFQMFDLNQDGVVSANELPERVRERMLKRADKNEDGEINQTEFKTLVQKKKEQGQGGKKRGKGKNQRPGNDRPQMLLRDPENLDANQVMRRLDRNNDGSLQKSEMPKTMVSRLDRIDENGDAAISISELRSAIEMLKARAMDAGNGRYSTDSAMSKGQVPRRPGSGDDSADR